MSSRNEDKFGDIHVLLTRICFSSKWFFVMLAFPAAGCEWPVPAEGGIVYWRREQLVNESHGPEQPASIEALMPFISFLRADNSKHYSGLCTARVCFVPHMDPSD